MTSENFKNYLAYVDKQEFDAHLEFVALASKMIREHGLPASKVARAASTAAAHCVGAMARAGGYDFIAPAEKDFFVKLIGDSIDYQNGLIHNRQIFPN